MACMGTKGRLYFPDLGRVVVFRRCAERNARNRWREGGSPSYHALCRRILKTVCDGWGGVVVLMENWCEYFLAGVWSGPYFREGCCWFWCTCVRWCRLVCFLSFFLSMKYRTS
ncbi:unnamed protein product [Ectocarpus fasciculatus]